MKLNTEPLKFFRPGQRVTFQHGNNSAKSMLVWIKDKCLDSALNQMSEAERFEFRLFIKVHKKRLKTCLFLSRCGFVYAG